MVEKQPMVSNGNIQIKKQSKVKTLYDKLIQLLVWQIVKPEKSIIMGGTYRIPVIVKLLYKNFIRELKMDGTFNESSFDREYESKWSGTVEDAFFNA